MKAPRVCKCGAVVAGNCIACTRRRQQANDQRRPSSSDRGYDGAWRKLRARYLAQHPTCRTPGCSAPAREVDHIETVRDRPDLRLEWSNLRALCRHHHSQRSLQQAREAMAGRETLAKGHHTARGQPRAMFMNSVLGQKGQR